MGRREKKKMHSLHIWHKQFKILTLSLGMGGGSEICK